MVDTAWAVVRDRGSVMELVSVYGNAPAAQERAALEGGRVVPHRLESAVARPPRPNWLDRR